MNALFVGDNRSNLNWGRAASIALHDLLVREFLLSGLVKGTQFDIATADAGFVHTLLPQRHYPSFRALLQRRHAPLVKMYLSLERLLGARDVIDQDPSVSVRRILQHSRSNASLQQIVRDTERADIVIIDGDGDMQWSQPARRQTSFVLAVIALGLHLGKPILLINTMLPAPRGEDRKSIAYQGARELICSCSVLAVRDPISMEVADREFPGPVRTMFPDSLFAWFPMMQHASMRATFDGRFTMPYPEEQTSPRTPDFSQPYICIGGGAESAAQGDASVPAYVRLVQSLQSLGLQVCLIESDGPDRFLRTVATLLQIPIVPAQASVYLGASILASARVFISGRYHPSILASLGGTPCIFLDSHGHKMQGLMRLLNCPEAKIFRPLPDEAESGQIVRIAADYLQQGDSLRNRIRQSAAQCCAQVEMMPSFLSQCMSTRYASTQQTQTKES